MEGNGDRLGFPGGLWASLSASKRRRRWRKNDKRGNDRMSGADELLGLEGVATLVTGAGAGIAKATALAYAKAGARIACADIDPQAAAAIAAEIVSGGGEAIALHADVTNPKDVHRMVTEAEARFGPLEVAVNVVGGFGGAKPTPFMDITPEEWETPIRRNLTATMLCCQAQGIAMARSGTRGRIVNFASTSGVAGSPSIVHYGAANAAVIHLTKSVALEYAAYGIRVNCVVPGTHWTAAVQNQVDDPVRGAQMRAFFERTAASNPMGRLGEPAETAGAALFLGSRLSDYMTGHVVVSDGGIVNTTARGAIVEDQRPTALTR
jgi:NAD(P)-dependent dehydrogenase (short-subunit alcohol dehydrogenase family)